MEQKATPERRFPAHLMTPGLAASTQPGPRGTLKGHIVISYPSGTLHVPHNVPVWAGAHRVSDEGLCLSTHNLSGVVGPRSPGLPWNGQVRGRSGRAQGACQGRAMPRGVGSVRNRRPGTGCARNRGGAVPQPCLPMAAPVLCGEGAAGQRGRRWGNRALCRNSNQDSDG